MRTILILSLLCPLSLLAQDFTQEVSAIQSKITQQTLESMYSGDSQEQDLHGAYLSSLVKVPNECAPAFEESKDWQLLFVSEVTTLQGKTKIHERPPWDWKNSATYHNLIMEHFWQDHELQKPMTMTALDTFLTLATDAGMSNKDKLDFSLDNYLSQGDFLELSEDAAAEEIGQAINKVYGSDENAKLSYLSDMSARLYDHYNWQRLPGKNPSGKSASTSKISLNQILHAREVGDYNMAGVCTDISVAMAKIAQKMFPKDKDFLVVNQGIHFGFMLSDGKSHKFVDGGRFFEQTNNINLNYDQAQTQNIRINKLEDGKLKQIALMDTQLGDLLSSTIDPSRITLSAGVKASTVKGVFETIKTSANKTTSNSFTAMSSELDNAHVLVVLYKKEKNYTNGDRSILAVSAASHGDSLNGQKVMPSQQFGYHKSFEKQLVHYKSSDLDLKVSGQLGSQFGFTVARRSDGTYGAQTYGLSGNMELITKAQLNYHPKDSKFQGTAFASTQNVVGNNDWEESVGKLSQTNVSNILGIMKNTTFNLNQVNTMVKGSYELDPKTSMTAEAAYNGSNVGQSVLARLGLDLKVAHGMKIMVYVGAVDNTLKGYKTHNSLLPVALKGGQTGARVQFKKGLEAGVNLQGLGSKTSGNVQLRVPLAGKRKPAAK